MNAMDWQVFALSLQLATVTTAILLAIAVPLAALLVLGRGRWLAALEALATSAEVLLLREGRQAAHGPAAEVLAAERERIALRLKSS